MFFPITVTMKYYINFITQNSSPANHIVDTAVFERILYKSILRYLNYTHILYRSNYKKARINSLYASYRIKNQRSRGIPYTIFNSTTLITNSSLMDLIILNMYFSLIRIVLPKFLFKSSLDYMPFLPLVE